MKRIITELRVNKTTYKQRSGPGNRAVRLCQVVQVIRRLIISYLCGLTFNSYLKFIVFLAYFRFFFCYYCILFWILFLLIILL